MKTLRKKLQALFFLFILVVGFSQTVSAQDLPAPDCTLIKIPLTYTETDRTINIQYNPSLGLKDDRRYRFKYSDTGMTTGSDNVTDWFDKNSTQSNWTLNFDFKNAQSSPKTLYLEGQGVDYCATSLLFNEETGVVDSSEPGQGKPPEAFNVCDQAGAYRTTCDTCMDGGGIWTGVGCIPYTSAGGTIRALMTIGLGLTGTVVVLTTLYAGFMFSTSQGDPKRVDEAKAAVTSAIAGAFFIIFSVTLLRFIGVTLLRIPGFG